MLFPDNCGAVPCEVEKIPGARQFSQLFGTKVILQTGQYQTAHTADISPGPDDSQSMRLVQFGNGIFEVEST